VYSERAAEEAKEEIGYNRQVGKNFTFNGGGYVIQCVQLGTLRVSFNSIAKQLKASTCNKIQNKKQKTKKRTYM